MLKNGFTKSVIVSALFASVSTASAYADHHGMTAHIAAAVAHKERPVTDSQSDINRKPAEVLAFVGVQPGMTVVDINSGGGYYTELLSYAVGETGTVYAHNGPVYWDFVKTQVGERFNGRLPNVVQIHAGTENVTVAPSSVDIALTTLAYHDYYFLPEGRTDYVDVPAVLASIYNSLKTGGVLVVIDHVAPEGTGYEASNETHRIDPEYVKQQVEDAGFKLAATSDILSNAEDDHTTGVFDKSIRGKTDRFIYKFTK